MFRLDKYKRPLSTQRAFTIVELLVTLTIVVLVTGIVMIRYSSFNSSVLLTSQAYLTAFDVREAQSLAVSVRGRSSEFREEYGLYFDMGTPNSYILFQDDDSNGENDPVRYNTSANDEAIGSPYKIDPRFTILNVCGTNNSSRTCYTDDEDTLGEVVDVAFNNVAISFQRPDFDAEFYSSAKSNIQTVEIIIGNEDNPITKKVTIHSSGQITVE
jgi:prepilin-type N-terminal cleavage/methylation domain-containing protein